MKGIVKLGLGILAIAILFFLMPESTNAQAVKSYNLSWRPDCTDSSIIKKTFDDSGNYKKCLNGTDTIFIKGNVSRNFYGQLFKRGSSPVFIDGIVYTEPLGRLVTEVNVSFDYYFPFYEDGAECPVDASNVNNKTKFHNNEQFVFVGNNNANLSRGDLFNIAFINFTSEASCGTWLKFNRKISGFSRETGFDILSSSISVIGFEVSNVYIRNITLKSLSGSLKVL
jgi:hypothetical protein